MLPHPWILVPKSGLLLTNLRILLLLQPEWPQLTEASGNFPSKCLGEPRSPGHLRGSRTFRRRRRRCLQEGDSPCWSPLGSALTQLEETQQAASALLPGKTLLQRAARKGCPSARAFCIPCALFSAPKQPLLTGTGVDFPAHEQDLLSLKYQVLG